jgi:hypothetical protein
MIVKSHTRRYIVLSKNIQGASMLEILTCPQQSIFSDDDCYAPATLKDEQGAIREAVYDATRSIIIDNDS